MCTVDHGGNIFFTHLSHLPLTVSKLVSALVFVNFYKKNVFNIYITPLPHLPLTVSKLFLLNIFLSNVHLLVSNNHQMFINFYEMFVNFSPQGPGGWWRGSRMASASLQRGTGAPLSKQVRGFFYFIIVTIISVDM